MDKTPGQVAYEARPGKSWKPEYHEWTTLSEHLHKQEIKYANLDSWEMCAAKENWERIAAAVIAHVTPQIRAAAIEEAITILTAYNLHFVSLVSHLRTLAPLPPSHVCVPAEWRSNVCDFLTAIVEVYDSDLEGSPRTAEDARALLASVKELK